MTEEYYDRYNRWVCCEEERDLGAGKRTGHGVRNVKE
jgi:hypothetical protein